MSFPLIAQELNLSPNEVNFKLSLEGSRFSSAINILLMMTFLSIAPSLVLMMTSFTRIVIVISFLKQAMGTQQAPSGRTVSALAIFLTIFIMQPVWTDIYENAIQPLSDRKIDEKTAYKRAVEPLKSFMLKQTRDSSLLLFMEMAEMEPVDSVEELPMRIVVPAFMLSELKTAFQMAFLIYLPFLVIDIVVATILMSMGMIMLPPMMISLPFKLLLFVMFNGWELLVKTLVTSFY
ncbi:MAG: flagellar type III secretion system pore protein FliP [Lentisphaeria bacterium]|nr:flagellar type III secretion system pore protein FliP [Lentisphaeria bacterium]